MGHGFELVLALIPAIKAGSLIRQRSNELQSLIKSCEEGVGPGKWKWNIQEKLVTICELPSGGGWGEMGLCFSTTMEPLLVVSRASNTF